MTFEEKESEISEINDKAVFLGSTESAPTYNDALIGMTVSSSGDPVAVYDYEKTIECFVREGMTYEEAVEFFDYNTLRSLPYIGEHAPVFVRRWTE